MIRGLHLLLYSRDAAADRAFLRDVLGWPHVEGVPPDEGWLIFATPPAELAVHPTDGTPIAEMYLMCDDVAATVADLNAQGVPTSPVSDQGWGLVTVLTLPSGAELGLYQPRHASPLGA